MKTSNVLNKKNRNSIMADRRGRPNVPIKKQKIHLLAFYVDERLYKMFKDGTKQLKLSKSQFGRFLVANYAFGPNGSFPNKRAADKAFEAWLAEAK
jgi:hypothetical protein